MVRLRCGYHRRFSSFLASVRLGRQATADSDHWLMEGLRLLMLPVAIHVGIVPVLLHILLLGNRLDRLVIHPAYRSDLSSNARRAILVNVISGRSGLLLGGQFWVRVIGLQMTR